MTCSASATTPSSSSDQAPLHDPQKSFIVRPYRDADHKATVRMFQEGMSMYAAMEGESKTHWADYIQYSLTTDLADIEGTYVAPGGQFWVATTIENGKEVVVGTVGAEVKPNQEIELRRMSVNSAYRRYGIGRQLISTLEEWARTNGYVKVWLSTAGVAELARKFYLSLGYSLSKIEQCPYFELKFVEKKLL